MSSFRALAWHSLSKAVNILTPLWLWNICGMYCWDLLSACLAYADILVIKWSWLLQVLLPKCSSPCSSCCRWSPGMPNHLRFVHLAIWRSCAHSPSVVALWLQLQSWLIVSPLKQHRCCSGSRLGARCQEFWGLSDSWCSYIVDCSSPSGKIPVPIHCCPGLSAQQAM